MVLWVRHGIQIFYEGIYLFGNFRFQDLGKKGRIKLRYVLEKYVDKQEEEK